MLRIDASAIGCFLFFMAAQPSFAQTAYFSLKGEFTSDESAFLDQGFYFDLSREVTSSETLRFQSFAHSGGTNATGEPIPAGGFDSIFIFSLDRPALTISAINDNYDTVNHGLDALLSWPGFTPNPSGTNIPLTSPLAADAYVVGLGSINSFGPWAVDLVGPADAMTLTRLVSAPNSTVDSLSFGTTGAGIEAAVVDVNANVVNFTDHIVVADDGNAELTLRNGGMVSAPNILVGTSTSSEIANVLVTGTSSDTFSPSTLTAQSRISIGSDSSIRVEAGGAINTQNFDMDAANSAVEVTGVSAGNGSPSSLTATGRIRIGDGLAMLVDLGARVDADELSVGNSADAQGRLTVQGTDALGNPSTVNITQSLSLGYVSNIPVIGTPSGSQVVKVLNGGHLISNGGVWGTHGAGDSAVVDVSGVDAFGNPATWTNHGNLELGATSPPTPQSHELNLFAGSLVETAGNATLLPGGAINITGGTLTIAGRTNLSGGAIIMGMGEFNFGTTTLTEYSTFIVFGGTLSGNVEVSGVQDAPTLANFVNNTPGVNTAGVIVVNSGVISGWGTYNGGLANQSAGVINVNPVGGDGMQFNGAASTNAGAINLNNADLTFGQVFTNLMAGTILGDGTLGSSRGIINQGTINFNNASIIEGDFVNDAGGLISIQGPTANDSATLEFKNGARGPGTFFTSAGSFTIFSGSAGTLGDEGLGTVTFKSDYYAGLEDNVGESLFAGNLVFDDAATLTIDFLNNTPGTGYDTIEVDGDATIDGALNLNFLTSSTFAFGVGESYEIVSIGGGVSGGFNGLAEDGFVGSFGGADVYITYAAGDGNDIALYTLTGLSGDYNNDGVVDAADYTVWRDNLNAPAGTLPNDASGSAIGSAQYDAWRSNYGATLLLTGNDFAVPEPAAALLLASVVGLATAARAARRC